MISFYEALSTNPLLLSAVVAGLAASFVSGIIGSYVVVKRIVFISGSISHSVLKRHRILPLAGTSQRDRLGLALVWSLGSSNHFSADHWMDPLQLPTEGRFCHRGLMVYWHGCRRFFISQTPGFNVELTNFLIGNILWVTSVGSLYFIWIGHFYSY